MIDKIKIMSDLILNITGKCGAKYISLYFDGEGRLEVDIHFKEPPFNESDKEKEKIKDDECINKYYLLNNAPTEVQIKKMDDKPKTYLDDLLEKYPNTILNDVGTPLYICPYYLGLGSHYDCERHDCKVCWDRPMKKEESNESTDIC